MFYISLSNSALEALEDPCTDKRLLPEAHRHNDNTRRRRHCKLALRKAIEICASPQQREQLALYYEQGLSKSEIAQHQGKGCSAITKSMRACLDDMRKYVNMYMEIYDSVERECLSDDAYGMEA